MKPGISALFTRLLVCWWFVGVVSCIVNNHNHYTNVAM